MKKAIKSLLKSLLGVRATMPIETRVRWFGADSISQAANALVNHGRNAARSEKSILVIGDGSALSFKVIDRLKRSGVQYELVPASDIASIDESRANSFSHILCALTDAGSQTYAAAEVASHSLFSALPFEHVTGLDYSRVIFQKLDEYVETTFVSPVLLDDPSPYEIYRESLSLFEQKCGLRDFLDLYQLIKSVVVNGVVGDIAEFGSFRGHSGWLIARTLEVLESDKRVYLFDTFESFPVESYGVDHFWSDTHPVDYESVRVKFADRPAVTLVKGDFTQTLADSGVDALALAYIDCDSYRATRFLLETLPEDHISSGGAMICEDYGHPALLGNRVAVHQVCDSMTGWFRFFSQFSGLYIMIKMGKA